MPDQIKVVRDFIYIDVEKLYSLYSQINKGIADKIFQSWTSEGANRDVQKGSFGSRKSSEETVAETFQETSSLILYDYLYNSLEESLANAILKPDGINPENWHEVLADAYLIKVEGLAEINDYKHLVHSVSNFGNGS